MKAPRKLRRVLTIAAVLLAALVTAIPAYADPIGGGGDGGDSGGGGDGRGNFYAYVKSRVHVSGSGYKGDGNVNVPDNFDPPHCWYQPEYTYDEMREWAERIHFVWHHQGPEDQRDASQWYKDTLDQIKPHENEPGNIFWFLTDDGTDEGWACYTQTDPFWIYVGEQEPTGPGEPITPVDLAKIARANLTLPAPTFELHPPAVGGVYRSYVGLETIISPPKNSRPTAKTVTASIDGAPGLTATVTATPAYVKVTSSGPNDEHILRECPEYEEGMNVEDTCYLRFARASTGGPYTITVTQYWNITSEPAAPMGENPFPMPSEPETIVVDEIQSVANG
ncbi:hypothetical protein Psi02_79460 [Planotetraspora silvatica]|uniref:Enoyl reductase n=1 Tax=Planotetraspora silvatica TaxID=234614 RepID=A0A8J3UX88_9ACTN|nr:hypothetical protein [Planotetraspora silvatica]GII51522.1 hypothetical protein Psi02_79460 [Planotetraspora silvatica]